MASATDGIESFVTEETGATSIEYALVGSLVSIVIVAALTEMSPNLLAMYQSVVDAFGN